MTFFHLSGNLWIPSQKNCAGLAAKNESSQFMIPCSDVNRIPVNNSLLFPMKRLLIFTLGELGIYQIHFTRLGFKKCSNVHKSQV